MTRPHVTDHALLRYLERRLGIDVDTHRAAIEEAVQRGVEHQACGVLWDGMRFRLVGHKVVTCVHRSQPDVRTGRARGRRGVIDGPE